MKNKIRKLEEYLTGKKAILGFSAGSDSTLLAYILSKVSPESLLVTIDNNMFPQEFIEYTQQQAKYFGLKHKVIKLDFLKKECFRMNKKERCYECRKIMYSAISSIDEFDEYDLFIEGTNITDLLEDRPGVLVKEIFNMKSPLVDCEISKDDVYAMLNYLNLDYSHDTTCLATRVKTGCEVSFPLLEQINDAENVVRKYVKQDNIRVRYIDKTAVISIDNPFEILDKDIVTKIRENLEKLGFKKVYIDVTGYKKTTLEYSVDENGNYYYKLPYKINLKKTRKNMADNESNADKISINNVSIEENGKITLPPTDNFVNDFNKILKKIERKEI